MKKTRYILFAVLAIFLMAATSACSSHKRPSGQIVTASSKPSIFPDYTDVTIPYNIAPLDFRVNGVDIDNCYASIKGDNGTLLEGFGKQFVRFDMKKWHSLLDGNKGKKLTVTVSSLKAGKWTTWAPFSLFVSADQIDSHLVYRLIEPGYEKWHIVGIYQRDLTSYDEKAIIRNDMVGYNCMNCHSFCMQNPDQMMFHMRATNGGTYIIDHNAIEKLDTKTDSTISNMTYPYWHPSGKYLTTSLNTIKQFFHSVTESKMEVFDTESDVIVYDIQKKQILKNASVITKDKFETFPSFSPDGKWLYYCVTDSCTMPDSYASIRYAIVRVPFDAATGTIHQPADTIVSNAVHSSSFPRISPDGRYLMYTRTAFGQFPIWHKDADLEMVRLSDGQQMDISTVNSNDTESYHSWSSNSHWVAFSSRRDNGLYTLVYFCHIDKDGRAGKPFMMPQRDPNSNDYKLYSYNIPELVKGKVKVSPYAIEQVAKKDKPDKVQFK